MANLHSIHGPRDPKVALEHHLSRSSPGSLVLSLSRNSSTLHSIQGPRDPPASSSCGKSPRSGAPGACGGGLPPPAQLEARGGATQPREPERGSHQRRRGGGEVQTDFPGQASSDSRRAAATESMCARLHEEDGCLNSVSLIPGAASTRPVREAPSRVSGASSDSR